MLLAQLQIKEEEPNQAGKEQATRLYTRRKHWRLYATAGTLKMAQNEHSCINHGVGFRGKKSLLDLLWRKPFVFTQRMVCNESPISGNLSVEFNGIWIWHLHPRSVKAAALLRSAAACSWRVLRCTMQCGVSWRPGFKTDAMPLAAGRNGLRRCWVHASCAGWKESSLGGGRGRINMPFLEVWTAACASLQQSLCLARSRSPLGTTPLQRQARRADFLIALPHPLAPLVQASHQPPPSLTPPTGVL